MTVSMIAAFLILMWIIQSRVDLIAQRYWEKAKPKQTLARRNRIVVGTTWITDDEAVEMMHGA